MLEHIFDKNRLLGIIIRVGYRQKGIRFFTPNEFSQQLAYMKRPNGYCIAPHIHNPVPRKVIQTQEVLYIKSGRVRVDFFNNDQSFLESRELGTGDVILLADGGHGFTMLEESEIIEVKQGPYAGVEDKTVFSHELQ